MEVGGVGLVRTRGESCYHPDGENAGTNPQILQNRGGGKFRYFPLRYDYIINLLSESSRIVNLQPYRLSTCLYLEYR